MISTATSPLVFNELSYFITVILNEAYIILKHNLSGLGIAICETRLKSYEILITFGDLLQQLAFDLLVIARIYQALIE